MKIFVTGANGQLGKAIQKQLIEHELILTGVENLDITNLSQTIAAIKEAKPDTIINCAAYTSVDRCELEEEKDKVFRTNAIGPRNLAIAANEVGCELVHISTDYVFDGKGKRPYVETDQPNPQSVYGETKLAGENYVKEMTHRYYIIRTAWLYGDGPNFVKTMLKLAGEQSELKVVDDQRGSPTSAKELANMIAALLGTKQYGVYHGTCEGVCTWYDFTKEIMRLKNIDIKVNPVSTETFPRPAKRPAYSVLENYLLKVTGLYQFSHWKDAIKEYLEA